MALVKEIIVGVDVMDMMDYRKRLPSHAEMVDCEEQNGEEPEEESQCTEQPKKT